MNREDYYAQVENVNKIKEKQRHCKYCDEKKMTEYKLNSNAICNGCLDFIAGMDNFAKMGRNPPPT